MTQISAATLESYADDLRTAELITLRLMHGDTTHLVNTMLVHRLRIPIKWVEGHAAIHAITHWLSAATSPTWRCTWGMSARTATDELLPPSWRLCRQVGNLTVHMSALEPAYDVPGQCGLFDGHSTRCVYQKVPEWELADDGPLLLRPHELTRE